MASWIRKSAQLSEHLGRDDGEQVDADTLEELSAEFIFPEEVLAAARQRFMDDLFLAGASYRQLEAWFGIEKSTVHWRYKHLPPTPVDETGDRYMRRLAEVVQSRPRTFHQLVAAMQDKAGTTGQSAEILKMLGARPRSAATALGAPRKSQAKAKAAS
ncbi:hypothetical protein [Paludisphaera borealis]|uniref:Uncharacterized protein n=1 Tax=Paludisphaera borealis TaxID=1387353 RepID=A0A1U7CNG4_9BACT|nr:hypothetical protein [Paludisphaera borealis]APW60467.1 hypothetical protein BSF38_01937 [Paludisphaera borealis]